MRDTRNPQNLNNCINYNTSVIPYMRKRAQNAENEEQAYPSRFLLIKHDADNLSCLYSVGKGRNEIKTILESEVIDDYVNCLVEFKINRYFWLTNVICHCILTEVSDEQFDKLAKLVKKFKIKDPFLNFLIKYRQPDWPFSGGQFVQKTPYDRLKPILETDDADKGIKELLAYLKKWYNTYRGDYWHDLHTRVDGWAYCGYWCWEAAAIVKIMGWDDTKLKDNEYYPYDAVHW